MDASRWRRAGPPRLPAPAGLPAWTRPLPIFAELGMHLTQVIVRSEFNRRLTISLHRLSVPRRSLGLGGPHNAMVYSAKRYGRNLSEVHTQLSTYQTGQAHPGSTSNFNRDDAFQ